VAVSSLSPKAQEQLQPLLGISEHAINLIAQQRVLANLRFDGMYQRYEDVPEAHSKTLQWIFADESRTDPRVSPGEENSDEASSEASSEDSSEAKTGTDPAGTSKEVNDVRDEAVGDMISDDDVENSDDSGDLDESLSYPEYVPFPAAKVHQGKAAAKEALLNWLSSGTGIFHISGKLGSGKSTLMKFICEHESTAAMLRQWAGG
jgi:hypothetical protein